MTDILSAAVAGSPPAGAYFNVVKLVAMLVLVIPWLLASPWVSKDTKFARLNKGFWTALTLGGGVAGFVLWLVIASFAAGLMAYLVLTAAVLGAYVLVRNSRVDENEKILTPKSIFTSVGMGKKTRLEAVSYVKIYNPQNKIVLPPQLDSATREEVQQHNRVQEMLHEMLWRRASRVDLSSTAENVRVRYEVDGVVSESEPLSPADGESVIRYFKQIAGLDLEEQRRPQQAQISVTSEGGVHTDIVFNTAGTTGGQRIQFRILSEVVRQNIDELGMPEEILVKLRKFCAGERGLLIVAGRTQSGQTSTQYSLLRDQDAYIKQLATLEAKPELDLENVTQHIYSTPAELTKLLASVLRHGPDILMIDNCPDLPTARVIIDGAAQTNIILGLKARDAFTTLAKWIQLTGSTQAAVSNLKAILCQALVRKLCPTCKEAYRPDPQLLAKANLPADKIEHFYRPPTQPVTDSKGKPVVCETCRGSGGYFDRTATFELLELNENIRELIGGGASLSPIKAACRKNRMLYMQEQALQKVMAGETSVQEVIRVTKADRK